MTGGVSNFRAASNGVGPPMRRGSWISPVPRRGPQVLASQDRVGHQRSGQPIARLARFPTMEPARVQAVRFAPASTGEMHASYERVIGSNANQLRLLAIVAP